jgi:hypothetical protein
VFPASNVQNVCGIRIVPRPGRWLISSAELKKAKKHLPKK